MTPSETALKNCCSLTNAKKESVSLSNTHLCGCESEGGLFFSPPMLHTLLLSTHCMVLFMSSLQD